MSPQLLLAQADRAAMRSLVIRPLALRLLALLLVAAPGHAAVVEVRAVGSDGQPLAEAVVFLESRDAKLAARPLPGGVELEQTQRRFARRVTVVTTGTEVRFPNRDTVRHHVYSFSPAKTFELKLYTGTPATPVVFDKPGIAVLGCNIHDQMLAWVVIVETPHHATSDAQGQLRLDNVPPGSYRLRSWHPGLPPGAPASDEPVMVVASGTRVQVKLLVTQAETAR
jgi:plastocyanin